MLRTGLSQHRRSFWGWRRPKDWTSHLDPLYYRFHSHRTLKTRAKLLDKLRRRGKFDWGINNADFFSPKHVRWASRWDDNGWKRKHPWCAIDDAEDTKKKSSRDVAEEAEVGGYELSAREKLWKQQMESMRKRVENDPYEAIFGKRFEPFWSPLVPSWMREEMGLPVWKEEGKAVNEAEASKKGEAERNAEPSKKGEPVKRAEIGRKLYTADLLSMQKKLSDMVKTVESVASGKTVSGLTAVENSKPTKSSSYAYASSTSWDSSLNKTKKVEWDSVSGQTKKYEYDPISNRMVEMQTSKPSERKTIESSKESATPSTNVVKASPAIETTVVRNSTSTSSKQSAASQPGSRAVSIPVKQPADVRKSIPIPPPLSQPSYRVPIGFSPKPTSLGAWKTTAVSSQVSKPSVLATLPSNEPPKPAAKDTEPGLEYVTAESIRARISKLNPAKQATSTPPPPATNPQQQGEQEASFNSLDAQPHIDAYLKRSEAPAFVSLASAHGAPWDQMEKEVMLQKELETLNSKKAKLLKDEQGLFHIERQKRELMKLDQRIRELGDRIGKMDVALAFDQSPANVTESSEYDNKPTVLQPSLDRMQSKQEVTSKTADEVVDADDAAAHESTEPLETPVTKATVPAGWEKQADLLQADRVKRTTAKVTYPDMQSLITSSQPTARKMHETEKRRTARLRAEHAGNMTGKGWAEAEHQARCQYRSRSHMDADEPLDTFISGDVAELPRLHQEWPTQRFEFPAGFTTFSGTPRASKATAEKSKQAEVGTERAAKLEKANKMLEEEVQEQKSRTQAHERRQKPNALARLQAAKLEHETEPLDDGLEKLKATLQDRMNKRNQRGSAASQENAGHKLKESLDEVVRLLRHDPRDVANLGELRGDQGVVAKVEHADVDAERAAKLEKANKMLQEEVQEQNARMQAHEGRYADKIRSLRTELEVAYKQSSVHGEKHIEHIRALEKDLAAARKSGTESVPLEAKYADKIRSLRAELDVAYKQSAVHGEKHVERIRALEKGLAEFKKSDFWSTSQAIHMPQAEGDLAPTAAAFAGSEKWYKQATVTPASIRREKEKAEQKRRDQKLVKEVQGIYEKAYGVIDADHQQPLTANTETKKATNVVEVESDVDLGEALAKYETDQKQTYKFQEDQLENEMAAREREANERVDLLDTGSPKLALDAVITNAAFTGATKPASAVPDATQTEIQWAEPALYKVLVWDVGNVSTTTTTSSFTGAESPLSISCVLTHLKNPASYFSSMGELHGEGFQVIHATHGLLVFRKAKDTKQEVDSGSRDYNTSLYKVLYLGDWGALETATMAWHFAGTQDEISIASALAQLVRPEKFLPKIEELHQDGFSAIHATKDLLVFRKTPDFKQKEAKEEGLKSSLEDHGLLLTTATKSETPANAAEDIRSIGSGVNPVDGTTAVPFEPPHAELERPSAVEPNEQTEEKDYDIRHYPRVRREEYPVFTGTKRKWNSNHRRHAQRQERDRERESKDRKKSRWRWVLGTGLGAATVAYAVGAAAERGRKAETAAKNAKMEEAKRLAAEEKYDISDGLILGTFFLLSIVLLL